MPTIGCGSCTTCLGELLRDSRTSLLTIRQTRLALIAHKAILTQPLAVHASRSSKLVQHQQDRPPPVSMVNAAPNAILAKDSLELLQLAVS